MKIQKKAGIILIKNESELLKASLKAFLFLAILTEKKVIIIKTAIIISK